MKQPPICPGCGAQSARTARHQVFCTAECGKAYYNLMTKRGTVIGPLLIVAREAGRYKGGPSRELGRYARREADALISQWVIEDRAAGRNSALLVGEKMARAWRAVDVM
jgi:hypothetical protein